MPLSCSHTHLQASFACSNALADPGVDSAHWFGSLATGIPRCTAVSAPAAVGVHGDGVERVSLAARPCTGVALLTGPRKTQGMSGLPVTLHVARCAVRSACEREEERALGHRILLLTSCHAALSTSAGPGFTGDPSVILLLTFLLLSRARLCSPRCSQRSVSTLYGNVHRSVAVCRAALDRSSGVADGVRGNHGPVGSMLSMFVGVVRSWPFSASAGQSFAYEQRLPRTRIHCGIHSRTHGSPAALVEAQGGDCDPGCLSSPASGDESLCRQYS
ncbi:hypothetical protein GY45DRAFT_336218 [Cubamyces sp. BRFM 1775]|nr:hypothetical protein GY45DRAFT_336218 [Cubamyces sp. BRFM 1775]